MRNINIILSIILIHLAVNGQNIIPNPDFELYNECPTGYSGFFLNQCSAWTNISGSADYYNCDFYGNTSPNAVPSSGNGCAGMWGLPNNIYCNGELQRESIKTYLTEPLEKCAIYELSFDLRLSQAFGGNTIPNYGSGCLGFAFTFFSGTTITSSNNSCGCWPVPPAVIITCDSVPIGTYKRFTRYFIAAGNFDQLAIGPECLDTLFTTSCYSDPDNFTEHSAYINLDNLSLKKADISSFVHTSPSSICVGQSVTCTTELNTLPPGLEWSCENAVPEAIQNDSATFTFDSSGTYPITISFDNGCGMNTIPIQNPIEVHEIYDDVVLDSVITICENTFYNVANSHKELYYQWNDNISGSSRIFSSSGTYNLTVTDHFGCYFDQDTIIVYTSNEGLIFPNPTTEFWKTETHLYVPSDYWIYDNKGKLIYSEKNVTEIQINGKLFSLSSGTYLLKIKTGDCLWEHHLIFQSQ